MYMYLESLHKTISSNIVYEDDIKIELENNVVILKDGKSMWASSEEKAYFIYLLNSIKSLRKTIEITENKLKTYNNKLNEYNTEDFKTLCNKYPDILL